jgi:hypothetical protein
MLEDGVTGHPRRGWTYPDAWLAGGELEAGRGWGPGAAIASQAAARAAPQQAGHCWVGAVVSVAVAGDEAGGYRAVVAGGLEQRTKPCPAAVGEVVFSWFGP